MLLGFVKKQLNFLWYSVPTDKLNISLALGSMQNNSFDSVILLISVLKEAEWSKAGIRIKAQFPALL